MTERKKFIIDRSKWRSGGYGINAIGKGGTKLLNNEGYMCCLGQICLQLGINESLISLKNSPEDIAIFSIDEKNKLKEISLLNANTEIIENSKFCVNLMIANDNDTSTTSFREIELINLFDIIDVDVEFVGEVVLYME